ncbi:iron-sulfur cluster insertion protein ErpA [Candidatus Riesia pediculicola]|uniref:iron-sulfur cluster insertion protein ErpA n=1 Tax=Candidatus Riesia pediculicola TaxID=401619 RepID=UPI0009C286A7|nr:iron-sulfur cluster insertion protein ErpA [Candidatus Riesia pediculicola]ARC54178.1 iron-sulfur cluster insertion protein ErpA [Candidatus Riesia pediculicola]
MKKRRSKLCITKSAAKEIKSHIKYSNKSKSFFRIYIVGGGCSGLKYKFIIGKKKDKDDIVLKKKGIKLVIDPISFQYLSGSIIDFSETIENSQFIVNNPNASVTCNCGSSFRKSI